MQRIFSAVWKKGPAKTTYTSLTCTSIFQMEDTFLFHLLRFTIIFVFEPLIPHRTDGARMYTRLRIRV